MALFYGDFTKPWKKLYGKVRRDMERMEDTWESLYNQSPASWIRYPSGYYKAKRQNLRRYALKFNLKGGDIFYERRRVITTKEEGHTGVGKTPAAICVCVKVMQIWAADITGQVEAVVGPYKLYEFFFHSLQGTEWLSHEVTYAYLYLVIKKQQMKFPVKDIWLCPANIGARWILVKYFRDGKCLYQPAACNYDVMNIPVAIGDFGTQPTDRLQQLWSFDIESTM